MIRVFIDGPIVGDVRTDFPASLGHTIRVPIPRRITTCDCNPYGSPEEIEEGPEIVEYVAIARGPRVALMSSAAGADDRQLLRALESWTHSELQSAIWIRHCRDRRAFT